MPKFGMSRGNISHSVTRSGGASLSPSSVGSSLSNRYGLMGAFPDPIDPERYGAMYDEFLGKGSPGPASRGKMVLPKQTSYPNRMYPGGRYYERPTRADFPKRSYVKLPSAPLRSPPSRVRPSIKSLDWSVRRVASRTLWGRIGAGVGSLRAIAARVGVRALAALGPVGLVIAAVVGAAVIIGGIVYWVKSINGRKVLEPAVSPSGAPASPVLDTDVESPMSPAEPPAKDVVGTPVDWSGNRPWVRSPKPYHLPFSTLLEKSSVLRLAHAM